MTVGTFNFMCALMGAEKNEFECSLLSALAESKAQKSRWIKELQCLQVEMESALRFFQHQERFWQEKQMLVDP